MQNNVSSCKLCMQTNTGHPPKIPLFIYVVVKTASTVMKSAYEEWILKYGSMHHIIHNNGFEFVNNWSKTLYEIMGVKSIMTSPYKPTTNSQVERTNRTIISNLRKFVQTEPNKWS